MSPASPGCQQKTGDLQRRFESGLGTILMWIMPVPRATHSGETLSRLCLGEVVSSSV